jgi:SAM-dependent methyltransferase
MQSLNWYDLLISPLLNGLQNNILSLINSNISVLEVGCGTGELAKAVYEKGVNKYLGVDLNPEMIKIASGKVISKNFQFVAADFLDLKINEKFDYAIFPMIIHSISTELANKLLEKASLFADQIIIADYVVPQPKNFKALIVHTIEWLAGSEHFTNFKAFKKTNGLYRFYEHPSSVIVSDSIYEVFHIVKYSSSQ